MALSKIQAESMNLADTYAFTGTVSGTSDLVKISTTTVSGTPTIIEFTGIDDTYSVYKVVMNNLQLTGDGRMKVRLGTDSAYIASNYRLTGVSGRAGSGTLDKENKFTDSTFDITGGWDLGGATDECYNTSMYFYNLRGTSGHKHIFATSSFVSTGNYVVFMAVGGRLYDNSVVSKMKFGDITGSANINSGTVTLYGVKQ